MVIYNRNGEIGWSSDDDRIETFETYKEAKEYYDKIKVDKERFDFSINWKKLLRVRIIRQKW